MTAPWPWLAVTAKNLARNNIRDERSCQAAGLEVFDRLASSPVDVPDQVHAADQLRRLAKAMDVLTPLQRDLLTVLVEEGLTAAQVARRLGMQPGAVRMHLSRMRGRLADRFVTLGGQLSVWPLALLQIATRRFRRGASSSQPASMTAGSIAVSVAAAAVGVVVIGGGPMAPHAADTISLGPQTMTETATVHGAQAVAQRLPGAGTASHAKTVPEPPVAPAVTYRVLVSSTPTRPGKTVDAGMRVPTPVGTFYLNIPANQEPPDPGSPCPLGVGC
jgi:DNA-binding CsgD family transcriptional regulator